MARTPLLDRRTFLVAAGASFAAGLSRHKSEAVQNADAVYASAYRQRDGGFGVTLLTEDGEVVFSQPLPGRGHDCVARPSGSELIVFARRPGTFFVVIDREGLVAPRVLSAAEGRHFYGHGQYSIDGRLLYATENDFENARGVIGIYDATDDYRRIGEFESYGVGPHDMLMAADGHTLIIANGGIETHPDFPRAKLNLATMKPNLAFVDTRSGSLLNFSHLPPDLHKLSIRHLTLGDHGEVWFGCQNQGNSTHVTPLFGRVDQQGAVSLIQMPFDELVPLRGYIGSIAYNHQSHRVAVTSPKGGIAVQLDATTERVVDRYIAQDVCGVAPTNSDFSYSTGGGHWNEVLHTMNWDNHIISI